MSTSLQKRIHTLVRQVLDSYPGAWMLWCDPRGDWAPLLQRAAANTRMGGFELVELVGRTASELGGPLARRELQARVDAGESFVLLVAAPPDALGWLWAHALLAEQMYARTLRAQLLDWGWRPGSPTIGDDEVALLARQHIAADPAAWGGGGLQPDIGALLELLAAGADPAEGDRMLLDLTIEAAGLPALDRANLPRWRSRCLARLLATEAHHLAPRLVNANHELVIAAEQRPFALQVLGQWLDSLRLSRGLSAAIGEADRVATLGSLMSEATPKHGPFLSEAAERAVFASTCGRLAHKSGKELFQSLAEQREDYARHAEGFWGSRTDTQTVPWPELLRLGRAAQTLLELAPPSDWAVPADAVAWYTAQGWRLDQAGEEILRDLQHPTPELLELITPLRSAYRARWENHMLRWSDLWAAARCPIPDVPSAGDWLHDELRERQPTAIVVVDALRYDLGATLVERLNDREGTERATVRPGRAPLPSITALGMGMALPIPERELSATLVDGKWQLRRAGGDANLSIAAERRKVWQSHAKAPADALLDLAAVLNGAVPLPAAQRTRLVLFDAAIDKLGHDDELEAQGSSVVIERYLQVIRRLYDAGWQRILIVTDHGYIHWPSSEEKSVAPPSPGAAWSSRRAVAYSADTGISGPQALAPGGAWRVALPRGASSFRAYGGLGYFHGGASLQEWIIPCVRIEWPQQAQPLDLEIEPLAQVLSKQPRVMLRVIRSSLLIEDTVPRQVEVVIRDAQQRTILYRSAAVQVNPDQDQLPVTAAYVEGTTAERGTALQLEVRDMRTEEVIATGTSVLKINLTDW